MAYQPNTARGSVDGTLVLVLGILSLVTCPMLGPIALVLGRKALADLRQGDGDPRQRGMVVAGLWLGGIASAFLTIMVLAVLAAIVLPVVLTVAGRH